MIGRIDRPRAGAVSRLRQSRRWVALIGAVALVAVVMGAVAFGSLPRGGTTGAASHSPGRSSAAPTAAASTSATAGLSSPADSRSRETSRVPGTIEASVLETVYCGPGGDHMVFVGDEMFASCEGADNSADIREFDSAGKTIVSRSVAGPGEVVSNLIEDHGLWFSIANITYCSPNDSCPPFTPHLRRIDMATGDITFNLDGMYLVGDGLGYVWASPTDVDQLNDLGSGSLTKIDPVSLQTSTIPWGYGVPKVACGSLWGLEVNLDANTFTTTITRVDPASGSSLANFTEAGDVGDLEQTPSGCWATANWLTRPAETTEQYDNMRYIELGTSGVESRSPATAIGQPLDGTLILLNGGFWIQSGPVGSKVLQRVYSAQWKPAGPIYLLPAFTWTFTCAGGSIWVGELDGENKAVMEKLDIPLG